MLVQILKHSAAPRARASRAESREDLHERTWRPRVTPTPSLPGVPRVPALMGTVPGSQCPSCLYVQAWAGRELPQRGKQQLKDEGAPQAGPPSQARAQKLGLSVLSSSRGALASFTDRGGNPKAGGFLLLRPGHCYLRCPHPQPLERPCTKKGWGDVHLQSTPPHPSHHGEKQS